jgi:hypothetical protein
MKNCLGVNTPTVVRPLIRFLNRRRITNRLTLRPAKGKLNGNS